MYTDALTCHHYSKQNIIISEHVFCVKKKLKTLQISTHNLCLYLYIFKNRIYLEINFLYLDCTSIIVVFYMWCSHVFVCVYDYKFFYNFMMTFMSTILCNLVINVFDTKIIDDICFLLLFACIVLTQGQYLPSNKFFK